MAKNTLVTDIQKNKSKTLKILGFFFSRQSGSHEIWKNDQGKSLSIPAGRNVSPGVARNIAKQIEGDDYYG